MSMIISSKVFLELNHEFIDCIDKILDIYLLIFFSRFFEKYYEILIISLDRPYLSKLRTYNYF